MGGRRHFYTSSSDSEDHRTSRRRIRSKSGKRFFQVSTRLLILLLLIAFVVVCLLIFLFNPFTSRDLMICKGTPEQTETTRTFACKVPEGYRLLDNVETAKIELDKNRKDKRGFSNMPILVTGTAFGAGSLLLGVATYKSVLYYLKKGKESKKRLKRKPRKRMHLNRRHDYYNGYAHYESDASITDDYFSDSSYSSFSDEFYS